MAPKAKSIAERLERYTERVPFSSCWYFVGCTNNKGYGVLNIKGTPILAHRLAYEESNGVIPIGGHRGATCVLHSCDNPLCVNPSHLSLGTNQDNVKDMCKKGLQQKGQHHYAAKLSDNDIVAIRSMKGTASQGEIAKLYGITQSYVSELLSLTKRRSA